MPRRPRATVLVALLIGATLVLESVAASAQSLEEARRERQAIQERLDQAAERLADLEVEAAGLEDEGDRLTQRLAELEATVGAARERVDLRVRELYKRGPADPVLVFLSGADPDEALARAATMSRLVAGDLTEVEVASNAGTRLTAVEDRLRAQRQALAATRDEQRAVADELAVDLDRAKALEGRLEREEAERRAAEARRAAAAAARAAEAAARAPAPAPRSGGGSSGGSAAPSTGGKVCPVGRPHSFTDTWGAPRSGGRSHRGTDILAPRGQDVYAIVSGVWDVRPFGRSAGNWAILRGSDGTHYWYLHLERHLVGDGARVSAGQLVATNGDTGNARGTPHVHFEQHPGGGGAINPYPLLRSLCG